MNTTRFKRLDMRRTRATMKPLLSAAVSLLLLSLCAAAGVGLEQPARVEQPARAEEPTRAEEPARAEEDAAATMAIEPLPVVLCEHVRTRCAFDVGCGVALHNYFDKCDSLLRADSTKCHEECLYALVALMSTHQGRSMLDCTCRDRFCEEMKTRVEVCRTLVLEASGNDTVSCEMAHRICLVDPVCASAAGYYQEYCKRVLLQGGTCTERCLNSAEILRRQEQATRLNRCRCDRKADCLHSKERMVRLCYGVDGGGGGVGGGNKSGGGGGGRKNRRKHRPRMFDQDPDRDVVEMLIAHPEMWAEYDTPSGANGSVVRAGLAGLVAVVAAVVLVTRSSTSSSG